MTPFVSLGRWYAMPLSREQATGLLVRTEEKERERLRRGASCVTCRLARLIARFWLGEPVEHDYQNLAARLQQRRSPRAQALLELIYGQLLLAQRRRGALLHLDRGFAESRHLFAPEDYFVVLKRHALFRTLPAEADGPPLDLEDLLTTARVIERLQGHRRHISVASAKSV
jgi:hypothetical protein